MDHTTTWLATGGALAVALAILAWVGDHRRMRRSELDRVGFMPWTGVFFVALLAAVLLLGAVAKRLL